MREQLPPLCIFSVTNGAVNCTNEEIIALFKERDIDYTLVREGGTRFTFIVNYKHRYLVEWACARAGQEVFITVDEERNATAHFVDAKDKELGVLATVHKPSRDVFYLDDNNQYWEFM